MRIDPQCERLKNAHRKCMKAFKTCIPFVWVFQKFALRCMTALKSASPLYERVNNAHHGFMKAFKIVHLFLWVLQKIAWWFTKIIKVHLLCERFSKVQHGFMKALKNVHLPFMSLSKICIAIYEGHKNASPLRGRIGKVHHGFMKAVKMCISVLWVFQTCASRFMKATCVYTARSQSHYTVGLVI